MIKGRRWLPFVCAALLYVATDPAFSQGAGPIVSGAFSPPPFGAATPSGGFAMGAVNGGNMVFVAADASHNLQVNCAVGCTSGSASNATSGVATSSTNTGTIAYNYGFNGTTWDQLQVDASKFLKVNCLAGCAGGTFNNNADAVATSATNGQTAAWLYGFNGTTYDRLQVDGSKQLKVVLPTNAAINEAQINGVTPFMGNGVTGTGSQRVTIASDNTAFSVNAIQSGTWNIGTVTTMPSNMSMNLAQVNGVTVLTGTGAVGTGSARVAVGTDTATIAGSAPGTAGVASANVVSVQGIASMTHLLVTPDANSSVNVAQVAGTTTDTNSGNKSAGTQRVVLATDQPQLTNALLTNLNPTNATGGLTVLSNIVAANTTSVAVCASACRLYGIRAYNIGASNPVYIKLFNTAQASVTCGTPTPNERHVVPASGGTSGAGVVMDDPNGVYYSTALTYCVTGGIADNDTTAPAASTSIVNFYTK